MYILSYWLVVCMHVHKLYLNMELNCQTQGANTL